MTKKTVKKPVKANETTSRPGCWGNRSCSWCGSEGLIYLGTLGNLRHYRCERCGADCTDR